MTALEAKKKHLVKHLAGRRMAQMTCCPEQAPAIQHPGFQKEMHRRCCLQSQSALGATYQVVVTKLRPTE